MTSASIKWAKEHLDSFNALLARQLSSVQRGTGVWNKCMDIVHEHAAMLMEVGVDFQDFIGKGLENDQSPSRKQSGSSAEMLVAAQGAE